MHYRVSCIAGTMQDFCMNRYNLTCRTQILQCRNMQDICRQMQDFAGFEDKCKTRAGNSRTIAGTCRKVAGAKCRKLQGRSSCNAGFCFLACVCMPHIGLQHTSQELPELKTTLKQLTPQKKGCMGKRWRAHLHKQLDKHRLKEATSHAVPCLRLCFSFDLCCVSCAF